MVIDEDRDTLGEVTGINGAHGTAIAASSGRQLRDVRQRRAVVMFDSRPSRPSIDLAAEMPTPFHDAACAAVHPECDAHSSTVIDPAGS